MSQALINSLFLLVQYFSTLERLRFAQSPESPDYRPDSVTDDDHDYFGEPSASSSRHDIVEDDLRKPALRSQLSSDPISAAPYRRRIANPTLDRIYATPLDKLRSRNLSDDNQFAVKRQRQSVILDATDEAFLKKGKRHPQPLSPDGALDSPPASPTSPELDAFGMHHLQASPMAGPELKATADSLFDSFRWLEEDDDLDLRLFLDDYHFNLREDVPSPTKSNRPSFRRHMSITKLPFGRPSTTLSQPETRDAVSPTLSGPPLDFRPWLPWPRSQAVKSLVSYFAQ